jgi:hypothetical protein
LIRFSYGCKDNEKDAFHQQKQAADGLPVFVGGKKK